MTIEECLKIQFEMIEARNEEKLLQFIRGESKFRSGFKELLVTCKDKGVPLIVVTAGIDFCINYVFELNGVKSPPKIVCANSKFTSNGIRVSFPRYFETLRGCTNFKEAFVARHKKIGANVVYVGDGQSDY